MSRRSSEESVFEGSTTLRASSAEMTDCARSDSMASSHVPWSSMQACIQRWMRARPWSVTIRGNPVFDKRRQLQIFLLPELTSLQRLSVDHVKIRNVGIPLQQRRDSAQAPVRVAIQLPNTVDHVVAMRVQNVRTLVGVTRQMHLYHAIHGDLVDA